MSETSKKVGRPPKKQETQVERFNIAKAEIKKVLDKTAKMVIVDTKTAFGVKVARQSVQQHITAIEKKRKELKAPYLKSAEQIDSIAKELSTPLIERKEELISTIKDWEKKEEERREMKRKAEEARKDSIKAKIEEWRLSYKYEPQFTIEEVEARMEEIKTKVFLKKEYMELLPEAEQQRGWLLGQLEIQLDSLKKAKAEKEAREAEELRLAEEAKANAMAQARDIYTDLFGFVPADDFSFEDLIRFNKEEINRLQTEIARDIKTVVKEELAPKHPDPIPAEEPEKELAPSKKPVESFVKTPEQIKEEEDQENDKQEISALLTRCSDELDSPEFLHNRISLQTEYWNTFYAGFIKSLNEMIQERYREMLDQL